MIKKIDNYQHVIYECKTDSEVIKLQDIAFKGGWLWNGQSTRNYYVTTLDKVRCIILQKNKKIQMSSTSTEDVMNYYNNNGCLVVNSLSELNILINPIRYNEKRVLVYD